MHVQACQTADLAFNMPGVIAYQNFDQAARLGPAMMGNRVRRYDIEGNVYSHLPELDPGDSARLKYNSTRIKAVLAPAANAPYLFALRNEGLAAALDQSIEQRAAAFLDKYKFATQIQTIFQNNLPDIVSALAQLVTDLDNRFNEVTRELTNLQFTGARITTSRSYGPVMMMASSTIDPANPLKLNDLAVIKVKDKESADTLQRQETQGYTASVPLRRDRGDNNKWKVPVDEEMLTQRTTSESVVHPILDTALTHRQNRVAILKELIQHRSLLQKVPSMVDSLQAELNTLDLGIRTLQLNYAHTFLTPPIDGIITAIYKDVGESVEPGEPVLRVENDATIFFVGKIQWRGPIWPGRMMKVRLVSVFEVEGRDIALDAKVLSIRGHNADNDEWDIIAEATNPIEAGRPLLPLNYHLDPETDSVDF